MEDCCSHSDKSIKEEPDYCCPQCGKEGKPVKLITLKSLLVPEALSRLDAFAIYRLCLEKECNVVYYSNSDVIFLDTDLKVLVYPYCFGWTRQRLITAIEETGHNTAYESIAQHVKAGRCGCEVNNPKGSCCLGNIRDIVDSYTSGSIF